MDLSDDRKILPGTGDGKRVIETLVPQDREGTRLDCFLADRFTYRSRTQWQKAVTEGEILLNGEKTRPSRVLRSGERLSFVPQESALEEPPVDMRYTLLLERKDFLAVNKPPSIPVHPSGRFFAHTLLKVVEKDYGTLYPVNRLDRETSGVILFARDPKSAKKLSRLFEERKVKKKYLAIVHGTFSFPPFTAKGLLTRDEKSVVEKKRRFIPDDDTVSFLRGEAAFPGALPRPGKKGHFPCEEAVTFFRAVKCGKSLSLVEAVPSTGRLHQIRATLYSLGFPLAGDKLYGLDEELFLRHAKGCLTEEDQNKLLLSHQALHAWETRFFLPGEKEEIFLQAPLPEDFSFVSESFDAIL